MQPTTELYESLLFVYEHFNDALFDNELPTIMFTVQRKKGVMGYFAPERWGDVNGKKCHEIAINPSYLARSRFIEVMQTLVHEMAHCWQFCFGKPGRDYYHNKEWANKMVSIGLMPSSTGEPGGDITGQNMADYIIEGGAFHQAFYKLQTDKNFQMKWVDRMSLPRLFEPVIVNHNAINNSSSTISEVMVTEEGELDLNLPALSKLFEEYADTTFSDLMPDDFFLPEVAKRQTRYRYTCNGCGVKIYGKPKLNIRCDDCDTLFICA